VTGAICISASFAASVFAILDSTLLRPLPFPASDRIIRLDLPFDRLVANPQLFATLPGVLAALPLEDQTHVQVRSAFDLGDTAVRSDGRTAFVTAAFFRLFGARPTLGRALFDSDVGVRPRPAVVSHSFWLQHLKGDPLILGRRHSVPGQFGLNDEPVEIVGVMPAGFDFPLGTEVWLAHSAPEFLPSPVPTFARLKSGVAIDTIRSALPDVRIIPLRTFVRPASALAIALVVINAVLLFLVTWIQIAAYSVGRIRDRAGEFRIRYSLGAGRWQLMSLAVRDVLRVGIVSAVVASLLAVPFVAAIVSILPQEFLAGQHISFSARAVMFTVAMHAFGVLIAVPASANVVRFATSLLPASAFDRRMGSFGGTLFALQIGLTAALLVISSAALQAYLKADAVALGVSPKGLYAFALPMHDNSARSSASSPQVIGERRRQSMLSMRLTPGIENAALSSGWPVSPGIQRRHVSFDDGNSLELDVHRIGHGWLATVQGNLIAGQEPSAEDAKPTTQSGRVMRRAFVNRSLFNVLGKERAGVGALLALSYADVVRVVGIIDDVSDGDFAGVPRPAVYAFTADNNLNVLLVRVSSPDGVAAAHQTLDALWGAGRTVRHVVSVEDVVWRGTAEQRARLLLMGLATLCCLPLVVAGIGGASRDVVDRRAHEVAVRLAVGETHNGARRLILLGLIGRAGWAAAAGSALGGLALNLIAQHVAGVGEVDLGIVGWTTAGVLAITVAAALVGTRGILLVSPSYLLKAK
jgi:putative ABC transport system permease protein